MPTKLEQETAACVVRWSTRGPRYTSYPPATRFAPTSAERVRSEVRRLGMANDPVSLYLHVPFCRSLCAYCGCNVIPTRDAASPTSTS
jgi:oxygen-independent coproporphyrinogen-3 oxidase